MKKLTKINGYILISSLLLEWGLLNYFLIGSLGITLRNNINALIRINVLAIGLDLILLIYLNSYNKKEEKIINKYKTDLNTVIVSKFIVFWIIKAIGQMIFLDYTTFNYYINTYIFYELFGILWFVILFKVLPKNEDYGLKIRRFKKVLRGRKNNFKYIIIPDEGKLTSTLEVNEDIDYKIDKDNFYIKNKEIKELSKEYSNLENIVKNKIVLKVNYVKDNEEIKKIYNKDRDKFIYQVMVKDLNREDALNNYAKALRIINKEDKILEEVENILVKEEVNISYNHYQRAKNKYNKTGNIKDLLVICKYYFQNRLIIKKREMPKDTFLLELYKMAYFTDSAYQSILILLNYMGALSRIVLYYLYAKNNDNFDVKEINREIAIDNIPIWKRNIYNLVKKDDVLYQNIKVNSLELDLEELKIIKDYMKYLLNVDIEGEELTFLGLFELIRQLRNKVEAHGSISEDNVYIIWYLFDILISKLNQIFKVTELNIEREKDGVKVKYDQENKAIYLGEYVLYINNELCFIFPKEINYEEKNLREEEKNYINYFNGNQEYKPYVLKNERK